MNEKRKRIIDFFTVNIHEIRNEITALLKELIRQKTVNVVTDQLSRFPYMKSRGEEYKAAELVINKFKSYGINFDVYSRIQERPNIIGRLGNNCSGKTLFMAGHMDIVPPGDGWNTEPFDAVEKDGLIYGRGAADNKGPIASIVVAAGILKKLNLEKELNGELQIAALSDEEATDPDGIDYGIGYLLENNLVNPTYAVIPDIGEDMKKIDIAEKGLCKIRITATGKQAHGSTPEKGINAINLMAKLLVKLENLSLTHKEHQILGHPTMNVGLINGGAAPNIVPGSASIVIDLRTVPGMSQESVIKQFTDACTEVDPSRFKIDVLSWGRPHDIDPENLLVKAIQKISAETLGFSPATYGLGGGTFAKSLCLKGTTAVGWGPGNGDMFHIANEYVEIRQLTDFSLITCLLAIDLLS